MNSLDVLLAEIRQCRNCEAHLPLGPRPVLSAAREARVLLAGQAPGTKVHASGIPWDDQSGKRLREWLDMEPEIFYDPKILAIVPMGFCYPGRAERGDLPPRPECADLWQDKLLAELPNIKITLAIGQYAIKHHLGKKRKKTLTETVKNWRDYLPMGVIPLVHPSPRNIMWRRRNPWFEAEIIPQIRQKIWATIVS
ncbi:MAG: uracil-DNA glycosylase family protein [Bacteroidota bacterium]